MLGPRANAFSGKVRRALSGVPVGVGCTAHTAGGGQFPA